MNVSLTVELESFVQQKVATGRYTSASEVVREALRLLEDQDRARAQELDAFRSMLDQRAAAMDRGEGLDVDDVFAKLREKSERRKLKK